MNRKSLQIFALMTAAAAMTMAADKATKSQAEADALAAVTKASNANKFDDVVARANDFVAKYPDSDFKSTVLGEAAKAYDLQKQYDKAVAEGDMAIEADPKNFQAMILVAGELAQHTPATDLTRADKLNKAEKYAKEVIVLVPDAAKPLEKMSDADWNESKTLAVAGAHYDLGLVDMARHQAAAAATEYKAAVDGVGSPDPIWLIRLGNAYNTAGRPDDAIPVLDKAINTPGVLPQVKAAAENEKNQSLLLQKNKKK